MIVVGSTHPPHKGLLRAGKSHALASTRVDSLFQEYPFHNEEEWNVFLPQPKEQLTTFSSVGGSMVSSDLNTTSIMQRRPTTYSDEKRKPRIEHGQLGDETIIAALRDYSPGTPEEKRLVRKIDFVLLPILWWMYVLAHLDRSNIANANAAGMSDDLGLSDNRKSTLSNRSCKHLRYDRICHARVAVLCGVRHV
jgi:hypothetical protein